MPFLMEIQRQELGSAAAIGAGILWGGPTTSFVRSGIGALTTNTMGGPGSDSSPSADSVSILVSEDGASATPMIADSGDSFPADSDWGQDTVRGIQCPRDFRPAGIPECLGARAGAGDDQ